MILNVISRFREFPNVVLTDRKQLWQMPFTVTTGKSRSIATHTKRYGWREIKPTYHLGQEKYRINRVFVTKYRLKQSAYPVREVYDNKQDPNHFDPFK